MVATDGVHLVADHLDELHAFARRLGLRREWFQDGPRPHYDLTTRRALERAVRAGAKRVSRRAAVRLAREAADGALRTVDDG
jgi:hypothetical protein